MASFNMRCKTAVLAVMMVVSSTSFGMATVPPVQPSSLIPSNNNKAMVITATVAALLIWIRLNSKGSSWDYTTEDWRTDYEALLNSYNIFDAQARATLLRLFDKWIVGRQLSIIDASFRSEDENGMVITRKEKRVKAKPFGLMGLFDAYVLCQLKKINEHVKEIQSVSILLQTQDTVGYLFPDKAPTK